MYVLFYEDLQHSTQTVLTHTGTPTLVHLWKAEATMYRDHTKGEVCIADGAHARVPHHLRQVLLLRVLSYQLDEILVRRAVGGDDLAQSGYDLERVLVVTDCKERVGQVAELEAQKHARAQYTVRPTGPPRCRHAAQAEAIVYTSKLQSARKLPRVGGDKLEARARVPGGQRVGALPTLREHRRIDVAHDDARRLVVGRRVGRAAAEVAHAVAAAFASSSAMRNATSPVPPATSRTCKFALPRDDAPIIPTSVSFPAGDTAGHEVIH